MSGGGALVLFSGGQDSTTCLAWALSKFERVETLGFDYGQRHRVELDVRGWDVSTDLYLLTSADRVLERTRKSVRDAVSSIPELD